MRTITHILFASALCATSVMYADCSHGAVRIVLSSGEEMVDCGPDYVLPGDAPQRPWYLCDDFDYYGDPNDPTNVLDYETQWPGEREDFSDYLMRDLP